MTVSILELGRTCERSYVGLRGWTLKHELTVLTCRRVTDRSSAYRICHHDRSSHIVTRIRRSSQRWSHDTVFIRMYVRHRVTHTMLAPVIPVPSGESNSQLFL